MALERGKRTRDDDPRLARYGNAVTIQSSSPRPSPAQGRDSRLAPQGMPPEPGNRVLGRSPADSGAVGVATFERLSPCPGKAAFRGPANITSCCGSISGSVARLLAGLRHALDPFLAGARTVARIGGAEIEALEIAVACTRAGIPRSLRQHGLGRQQPDGDHRREGDSNHTHGHEPTPRSTAWTMRRSKHGGGTISSPGDGGCREPGSILGAAFRWDLPGAAAWIQGATW